VTNFHLENVDHLTTASVIDGVQMEVESIASDGLVDPTGSLLVPEEEVGSQEEARLIEEVFRSVSGKHGA